MKKHSRYEQKLARRKRGGTINYSMTVDKNDQPTLNEKDFQYVGGYPKVKNFSRMRRADEL